MGNDKRWLAPLTGLAFFILLIIAFAAFAGDTPGADEGQKVIDFYTDEKDSQIMSAIGEAIAASLLVFFGGTLRRALRDAEGPEGILSAVAFAGTIIIATGMAIDATITFTLAETADELDPGAAQALSALYENDFIPMAVGVQVFLVAAGLSVLRHGALPKWIGVIALVLGIVATTPIGFVSAIGGSILIAVIGVILAMRMRDHGTGAAGGTATAAPAGAAPGDRPL
jgi:hypothetical protein